MQATDLRNQFNLHRAKVICLLLLLVSSSLWAQKGPITINRPESDKKVLNYGFFLGVHQNSFAIRYSEAFDTNTYENLRSVEPVSNLGFNLGFMLNFRLDDQFVLRAVPVKIALYQYSVDYSYIDGSVDAQLIESTRLEPGLFLKYRSIRRGNSRMYFVGGVSGSIRSRKAEEDVSLERLGIRRLNVMAEVGIGAELYFKFFKFSPELRYSRGMINALDGGSNFFNNALQRVTTHNFTLYLHFSD